MSDVPIDPRSPAEEDPVIHQQLVLLPAFSPRPGLAERILTQVWLPRPRRLIRFEERWRGLVASRRIWLFVAPFIAGSMACGIALTVAVVTHPAMVRAASRFVFQHGVLVAIRVALEVVGHVWATLLVSWAALPLAGIPPAVVIFAVAALWAACAWGLYRTLRVAVPVRKTVHAKR